MAADDDIVTLEHTLELFRAVPWSDSSLVFEAASGSRALRSPRLRRALDRSSVNGHGASRKRSTRDQGIAGQQSRVPERDDVAGRVR
jgi:hypothetical protein